MYITTVKKKNKGSDKVFEYQRLVESVRTPKGPRKKNLLNLGKLDLPKDKWVLLVQRIQDLLTGQQSCLPFDREVELLAHTFSHQYVEKYSRPLAESDHTHLETVSLPSVSFQRVRTVGPEHVGLSFFRKLGFPGLLKSLGFSQRQIEVASLLIIGRMISPGSELGTWQWAQSLSGLDELLQTTFEQLSHNTLYQVSDKLYDHQAIIEQALRERERDLFSLDETIILYDLTNTYFEGLCALNKKAKFGRSKEKRSDCRLMTLGLVLDGNGFPLRSRTFSGNQSEPKTLVQMVNQLIQSDQEAPSPSENARPTVVIDAGIATEENLAALSSRYHYVCVSRSSPDEMPDTDAVVIKDSPHNRIEAVMHRVGDEVYVHCHTTARKNKEESIRSRLQQRFEEELERIELALTKRGGTKKYQKVCERVGRAREKYSRVARFYEITVHRSKELASHLSWHVKRDEMAARFSGHYVLRTDRTDLSEEEIWNLYRMLTDCEDAFRTMKSDVGLRPNYHQKENRCDGHIFITVLAYHLVHSIITILRDRGLKYRWPKLRQLLTSHVRATMSMKSRLGKTVYIRKCSDLEIYQELIYDALGLPAIPCPPRYFTVENP